MWARFPGARRVRPPIIPSLCVGRRCAHTGSLHWETGVVWPSDACITVFPVKNVKPFFLQTPKNKATIFKLCSICLYLPQEQLTHWAVGTVEDHLHPYMPE